jgi:hypothetical protein
MRLLQQPPRAWTRDVHDMKVDVAAETLELQEDFQPLGERTNRYVVHDRHLTILPDGGMAHGLSRQRVSSLVGSGHGRIAYRVAHLRQGRRRALGASAVC